MTLNEYENKIEQENNLIIKRSKINSVYNKLNYKDCIITVNLFDGVEKINIDSLITKDCKDKAFSAIFDGLAKSYEEINEHLKQMGVDL